MNFFPDFKFAIYPPSMIAAGSVSAAASGLLSSDWCTKVNLIDRLQKITSIDAVSIFSNVYSAKYIIITKINGF